MIESAVARLADDLITRNRELREKWDGISRDAEKMLDEFEEKARALMDEFTRRSQLITQNVEEFTRHTHGAQQAIYSAREAAKLIA